jgi:putative FmdB family regulatory protein
MALYEYECEACGQRFELIRKFSDPPPEVCTLCGGGPVSRLPSSPAIQFKGSGFYITDYAKKGEGGKEGGKGEGGQADKTSTEKSQDAKSDAAAANRGADKGAGKDADKGAKTEGKTKTESAAKTDAPAKSTAPVKPSGSSSTPSGGSKD